MRILLFLCPQFFMLSVLQAQPPEIVLPIGHSMPVISAEFSNDSKKVLTLSEDGTAKLWDVTSGSLLRDFQPWHDAVRGNVVMATFSPDGDHIITGFDEISMVSIWGLNNRQESDCALWSDGRVEPRGDDSSSCPILTKFTHLNSIFSDPYYSPDHKVYAVKVENESLTDSIFLMDAKTGKQRFSIPNMVKQESFNFYIKDRKFFFTKNSKRLVAILNNNKIALYNVTTGSKIKTFSGHTGVVNIARFNNGETKIITASEDSTVRIWDVSSGKTLITLRGHNAAIVNVRYSADEKKIITASKDSTAKIWDAANGTLIAELKGHIGELTDARFNSDGSKVVTASMDLTAKVWNALTGNLIVDLKGHISYVEDAAYDEFGKEIILHKGNSWQIWNTESGILLNDTVRHYMYKSNGADFGKEKYGLRVQGYFVMVDSIDVEIDSMSRGAAKYFKEKGYYPKSKTTFSIQQFCDWENVKKAYLSPDNKQLVVTNSADIVRVSSVGGNGSLYPMQNLKFTVLSLENADFMVQLPSGYYQSTHNASKLLHYVTYDLKVITFEQLDVKYNRPDLVLEAIGNSDSVIINTYRNAYYKRIKNLGIDTSTFHDHYSIPEADFVNRDEIAFEQKKEWLDLHIRGIDSTHPLDRYNVWVNEVPVYGQRGISIRNSKSNSLDKNISIPLSEGENRIETSVINVNGTESYRMPLTVNYTPPVKQKETTYFIGIGIDQFKDTSYNLNYSVKDIRDLSVKLKKKYGNEIIIDTLFNENVTVSNVKALKQKLLQTTVNDKVLISYSGHGLLSKDYDYFLSTYAINFKNPAENGLAYDELENLLDSIPARKKLMLIDACHSGEVDKEEFQQVKINQSTLAANHVVSKGGEISESEEGSQKLGLKNSFELMQNLFVNVSKSTGATIISAAAGTEFALENGNLKNGVFTYCIMEAMDKYPTMKVSELKKTVGARVQELTKDMQKPTSRNEAIAVDWNVW